MHRTLCAEICKNKKLEFMKNLFKALGIFALLIGLQSCLDRENVEPIEINRIKIDSVKIPLQTMNLYDVQTIKTYSNYGSGCHRFYDYDYRTDGFNRLVTSYSYEVNENCTQATYVGASQFNFRPIEKGTYTFKFWNGKDTAGNDLWIDKQIIVQ